MSLPRYAYRLVNGRARDLRYVLENYELDEDEIEGRGQPLPDIDAVSTAKRPLNEHNPRAEQFRRSK